MKKYLKLEKIMKKYSIIGLVALFFLAACTTKELTPILEIGPAPAITSPSSGTSFELLEENADNLMPAFTWTQADFGYKAGITYTLEFDRQGNNFAAPVSLGSLNALTIDDITVGEFNTILISNGIPDKVTTTLELRVAATVSPEVDTVYSDIVTIDVNPYKAFIVFQQLGVPGSYQGWKPEDSTTAVYSRKNDNTYEGFLYFESPGTNYKFTQGPSWATNWGDDGADGTLDEGGADIAAGDAGMYRLKADLSSASPTHTQEKTDWGLIGSATPNGWDSDQDLTYDPASGNLSITVDLVAGAIKFRANDDWAINFGDNGGNGSLEYDGSDIEITDPGNYTIELILNVAEYTYTLTKN